MTSHIKNFSVVFMVLLIMSACSETKTKMVSSHYTDPEVSKIVTTANNGEISMARRALAVSQNSRVKAFAQKMLNDHTMNNKEATKLAASAGITPKESKHSDMLMKKNEKSMNKIMDLTGEEFDKAYMKDQVAAHELVLADLEKSLIPSAKNPDLKAELTKTADKVRGHLKYAKEVQEEL